MELLDKIKALRIESMKSKEDNSKLEVEAYKSVLATIDTARGRGVTIDDSYVIDTIKKESRIYLESQSNDPVVLEQNKIKSAVLDKLLPSQLTKEELVETFKLYTGEKNPKAFMTYLDSMGYIGQYNKGEVAKVVLGK